MEHLFLIPILLFSVVVHEIAHGWVAWRLGDPTARDRGRLTLNPIPHIDLFGSIIVPLMSLAATGSVFIAWAKPVPVDPRNFHHPRRDEVLVSVAGPVSNLLMALVCTLAVIGVSVGFRLMGGAEGGLAEQAASFLLNMFYGGVFLNVVLALFNLLPVPPLDGSHIVASVLPAQAAYQYQRIGFLGIIAILFLMRISAVSAAFSSAVLAVASPLQALMGLVLQQ